MRYIKYIPVYLITCLIFFSIDLLWLGIISKGFYELHLPSYMAIDVNWAAAVIFYLLYLIGVFVFAIHPSYIQQSAFKAYFLGALFGLFTYATYDLTNLATLSDWPIIVVIVDIFWGVFITSLISLIGYYITTKIKP